MLYENAILLDREEAKNSISHKLSLLDSKDLQYLDNFIEALYVCRELENETFRDPNSILNAYRTLQRELNAEPPANYAIMLECRLQLLQPLFNAFLSSLNYPSNIILRYYYEYAMTDEIIAEKIHYSTRHVNRLRERAINNLQKRHREVKEASAR